MPRRTKMMLLLAVSVVIWVGGVWYSYNSYNAKTLGKPGPGGYTPVLGKELKQDSSGKWVEKSFIEAKAVQLVLLTLVCGGVALFAGLRVRKRPDPEEEE